MRKRIILFILYVLIVLHGAAVSVNAEPGNGMKSASNKAGAASAAEDITSASITGLFNSRLGGDLRWGSVDGADRYVIYRTNAGKTLKIATLDGTQTSYMDTSIQTCWGKVYVYYVCAQKGSKISPRNKGRLLQRVAPMEISYLKNEKPGTVKVEWTIAAGKNVSIGYELQYAASLDELKLRTGTFRSVNIGGRYNMSKTVTDLLYGRTYYFRVRAYCIYTHSQTHVQTKSWSQYSPVQSVKMTLRSGSLYRAVVVGERNYKGGEYSALQQASYDSNAMRDVLKNYGYTVVKRENLSASGIIDTARNAFRNANQFDTSLFYYNGHASDDGSLYTVDGNSISLSVLAKELSAIPGRVIVILDCCYAGKAVEKVGGAGSSGMTKNSDPDLFNQKAVNAFSAADPGLKVSSAGAGDVPKVGSGELRTSKFYVLSACGKDELSYGVNNTYTETGQIISYAFFTYAFAEGAGCAFPSGQYRGVIPADRNMDGQLAMNEIFNYTKRRTYELSAEAAKKDRSITPQHVQGWPSGSSVVLMKKN